MKKHPLYSVWITEDGRVWKNGRWAKLSINGSGYFVVSVGGRGAPVIRVHRLVLETYVGPRPDGEECRHLDGDCKNNRVDNLRWGTRKEQLEDQKRHGTFVKPPVCAGSKNTHYKGIMHSAEMVAAITDYAKGAKPSREIAKEYGLSKTHLLRIFHRGGQKVVGCP